MAKQMSRYVCQECGSSFPKWQGQCTQCGKWNTLVETVAALEVRGFSKSKTSRGKVLDFLKYSQIKSKSYSRVKTGIGELDRVLGGGMVPGSIVLVAGEPGIGKSTLLTQLASRLTELGDSKLKGKVLYVCGEESPSQVKIRIQRLSKKPIGLAENFLFLSETNIDSILATIEARLKDFSLGFIVVDSVQTLWTRNLSGAPGSVGQVRECSNMLLTLAKKTGIPIFLVGHVTKEGAIAGPKVLEHLVDTVLYIEGDKDHNFRILRSTKNRFGPTDEVGVFSMSDGGMEEVENPAEIFLSSEDKYVVQPSGRVVTVVLQGLRPMLVEIQALVVPTTLPMPRRVPSGIDYRKLQVLVAVLQKRANLNLSNQDVFVNVVGGLKIAEPVVDLAVCLATASSYRNKPLPKRSVALGEVGLLGEIRPVVSMEKRVKEAKRLGYKNIIGLKERNVGQVLGWLK